MAGLPQLGPDVMLNCPPRGADGVLDADESQQQLQQPRRGAPAPLEPITGSQASAGPQRRSGESELRAASVPASTPPKPKATAWTPPTDGPGSPPSSPADMKKAKQAELKAKRARAKQQLHEETHLREEALHSQLGIEKQRQTDEELAAENHKREVVAQAAREVEAQKLRVAKHAEHQHKLLLARKEQRRRELNNMVRPQSAAPRRACAHARVSNLAQAAVAAPTLARSRPTF